MSQLRRNCFFFLFFFFNATATTQIYTLSLHDALPIGWRPKIFGWSPRVSTPKIASSPDRKSTRLNSSHLVISYAVFCLKKKTNHNDTRRITTKENARMHPDKEDWVK